MRAHMLVATLLGVCFGHAVVAQSSWSTTGNTGTSPGTHFIGTRDSKDVVFKVQNIERGRIINNGGVWRFGNSSNFVKIDGGGRLTFGGMGVYQVAANKYVFQYSGSPNIGLYYNESSSRHEFRDNNAAVAASIGTLSGNGYFKGNLGVGTASPAYKLDVSGTGRVTGTLKVGAYTLPSTDGSAGQVLTSNGAGTVSWSTVSGGGVSTPWASNGTRIYYNGGNVGVGTSYPSYKMDVNGTGRFTGNLKVGAYTLPSTDGGAGQVLTSNGAGSVSWTTVSSGGSSPWASNGTRIYYNSGNVGVGTSSPSYKIDVNGTGRFTGTLRVGAYTLPSTDGGAGQVLTSNGAGSVSWTTVSSGGSSPWASNGTHIYYSGGNIGVGTTSPSYKMDIAGTGRFTGSLKVGDYTLPTSAGSAGQVLTSNGAGSVTWTTINSGSGSPWATNGANITFSGGDVAIGTTDIASGYKLSVDGKIICEEVKVQLASNWPDYVFEKDYELMPIEVLADKIEKHKHLPGIPSAKEIEESGIAVGEMQAKMMEKIEELTIYLIDANSEMKAANAHITTLQGDIEKLQQRIKQLEKQGN